MTSRAVIDNLRGHVPEPTVQDQVIAYIDQLGGSFILRDIYRPLGLPRYTVNRVLGRLHAKGFLNRQPFPVQTHRFDRRTRNLLPAAATRNCYLYSLVDEAA